MVNLPARKQDRGGRKAAHNHAPKMEKRLASDLNGRTVKGSGCGDEKGDVRIKGILRVEAKSTSRKSFSVTREIVEKIEAAAIGSGEVPAIVVEFLDEAGKVSHTLAIVPTYVLNQLVQGGV